MKRTRQMQVTGLLAVVGVTVLVFWGDPGSAAEGDDTERAQELFAVNCAACHGPTGTGLVGPSLVEVNERLGREEVARTIAEGREDRGMPQWGGVLSDEEIELLVSFTDTLPTEAQDAGNGLVVEVDGLDAPTSMIFTDDGGLYVGEKQGTIKYAPDLASPAVLVADLTDRTYDYGELGLTGIEVHEDHVYVTLQTGMTVEECGPFEENYDSTCVSYGAVLRLPMGAEGRLGEPELVRGGPDDPVFCAQFSAHGIAGLYARENGDLLVGVGDGAGFFDGDVGQHDGDPCGDDGAFRAQTPSETQAAGTISVIEDDGSLTTLAHGMRNPFAMTELDGQLYSINTGWDSWEEIDEVHEGHNSGWPCFEGFEPVVSYEPLDHCTGVRYDEPVFAYPNADPSGAISALAAYDGLLYFGDYVQQWVKTIDPALGPEQEPQVVARQLMPVALAVYDDVLYGLDIFAGTVVRIAGEPDEPEGPDGVAPVAQSTDGGPGDAAGQPARPPIAAIVAGVLVLLGLAFVRPRRSDPDEPRDEGQASSA